VNGLHGAELQYYLEEYQLSLVKKIRNIDSLVFDRDPLLTEIKILAGMDSKR
jgi:hypothetical protein